MSPPEEKEFPPTTERKGEMEIPEADDALARARPFLRGELGCVHTELPNLVSVLASAGAGECWHKHGDFLHHLVEVYRILHLWGSSPEVSLCGLFHSAYSNSYVNLAIFPPDVGRPHVRCLIGGPAEHLVHLFCIVPRQTLIHDDLLFRYTDDELANDLRASEAGGMQTGGSLPGWRKKLQSLLPAAGIKVKHIRTGEDVLVPRRLVAIFLLMTMADFSDQLFGFHDALFENSNGRLEFSGNRPSVIWPGNGKPGLWMNSISRMGALYHLIVREESLYIMERDAQKISHATAAENGEGDHRSEKERGIHGGPGEEEEDEYFGERMEDLQLVIPPVFDRCSKILGANDQSEARELYWQAVSREGEAGEEVAGLLVRCKEKNPFIGEPRVVLGQVYLSLGRFEEGEREAGSGLRLMLEWGSSWDKRMPWEGWIAWARVLVTNARDRSWPNHAWGILNLGLVK